MEPNFFTDQERSIILQAVQKTELKTGAEIVPLVAMTSSEYEQGFWRGLAVWIVLGGFIGLGGATALDLPWLVFISMILGAGAFWLLAKNSLSMRLNFLKKGELDRITFQAAAAQYYFRGMGDTLDETGVLVYLSLQEPRAWVLVDRGIRDKFPKERWRNLSDRMNKYLEVGDPVQALVEGLECVGLLLEGEIPRRQDDVNELPDLLCILNGDRE